MKQPLKIAFIRDEYDPYGGAERFTQTVIRSFAERGAQVHIFARKWTGTHPGIYVHGIGGLRRPSLLRHASFVYLVGKAVKQDRFDLVQSNERTLCQDIYRAGDGVHARWLEIRAAHQGFFRRLSFRINPFHHFILWLEKRLFEHPDLKAVIVNSDMVRREILARFRISEDRIHTIYNGVDLDRFSPEKAQTAGRQLRHHHGVEASVPVVLFVGSGFERKGLSYILKAMGSIPGRHRLWVVGKGNIRPYQKLAQQLGIASRVTFWGPQRDVMPFYAASDIFVFPSLYDPFPTAVLEAMATGLPVITSAHCGTAEIMVHGKEGFILSAPDAVRELAQYIETLSDPETGRTMSEHARRTAENFPMNRTLDEMQQLYNRLLQ